MTQTSATQRTGLEPLALDALGGVRVDLDAPDGAPALPNDHPAWQRDVLSISSRARSLIATLRPVVVRVLTAWDHRLRDLALGARRLTVDASGCYRVR